MVFYPQRLVFFVVAFTLATTAVAPNPSCPAGKFRQYGQCSPCAAGTYSHAGDSSCTPCSPGTFSTGGAAQCSRCPNGSISPEGAESCHQCPSGTIPASNAKSCSTCPRGTAPNQDSSACVPIPPQCSAGSFLKDGHCEPCPAGKYSLADAMSCTDCPAGTFSTGGAAQCSRCPNGAISGAGAQSCTQCPGGSIPASNGKSCSTCPRGTAPNQDSSACVPTAPQCPAGKFSSDGRCQPCPAGTFSREPGSTSCEECPEDTYSASGATSCQHCEPGHGCGRRSPPGQCKPKGCKPGHHKWLGLCLPCPRDTYEDGGRCKPCQHGLSSPPGSTTCHPSPSHRVKQPRSQTALTCNMPGFMQCRIATGSSAYECIDTQNTLDSCGGCVAFDGDKPGLNNNGRDCSVIEHANAVRCSKGRCVVESCRGDFEVSEDKESCVKSLRGVPRFHHHEV
ncbi:hypothetical protein BD410DRAFT_115549 [Rickenella mellea]|uniref:Uncharacterized protein n=1 Tax=Rickenella mellea TaxID=50990 RepID=A0A4Y7Q9K7_9AGAM|nr:hypothetical protein BD410DRAFT_115549 [Rickenella mellea]